MTVLVAGGVAFAGADSTKSSRGPAPSARSAAATSALVPLDVSITPGSRPAATPGTPGSSPDEGDGHTSGSASAPASAPFPGQRAAAGPSAPAAVSTSSAPAPVQRTFRLRGAQSGRCLDVPQSTTANGTQLDVWDCSGDPNQVWTQTASGQMTVYSGNDLRCLDAAFGGTTPGTFAIIWPCSSASNQWRFNANGTVTDIRSGLCLDVTQNSTGNGSPVQLWTCNGGTNQVWSSY